MRNITVEILAKARALIFEEWGQGRGAMPPEKGVCMLTAIHRATEQLGWLDTRFTKASNMVRNVLDGADLADWNDSPGRTCSEVLDKMGAAIELAKHLTQERAE